jgi:uncharacterized protein YkwD
VLCATLAVVAVGWAPDAPAATAAARTPRASAAAPCPGATLVPSPIDTPAVEGATLCLVNQVRAAHHLHTLRANGSLLAVAASQVSTMVSRNYFSDVRPGGQTPLALVRVSRYRAHAAVLSVGQNIAWGTGSFATPAHIVSEWMASAPHRAVILTAQYRDAGVAVDPDVPDVLRANGGGATYAMEFGVRRR